MAFSWTHVIPLTEGGTSSKSGPPPLVAPCIVGSHNAAPAAPRSKSRLVNVIAQFGTVRVLPPVPFLGELPPASRSFPAEMPPQKSWRHRESGHPHPLPEARDCPSPPACHPGRTPALTAAFALFSDPDRSQNTPTPRCLCPDE